MELVRQFKYRQVHDSQSPIKQAAAAVIAIFCKFGISRLLPCLLVANFWSSKLIKDSAFNKKCMKFFDLVIVN